MANAVITAALTLPAFVLPRITRDPRLSRPPFSFGKATMLWDASDTAPLLRNYDPAPDGTRFAVAITPRGRGTTQFIVIENWTEELKQRLSAKP